MTSYEIRQASESDLIAFYGELPKKKTRSIVALIDGHTVAVAGLHYEKEFVRAFSDMRDSMRPHKKFILRVAKKLAELAKAESRPVLAVAELESSHTLLPHLGFKRLTDEVYQWHN